MEIENKMCRNEICLSRDPSQTFVQTLHGIMHRCGISFSFFFFTGVVLLCTGRKHKKMQQISLESGARKLARKQSYFTILLSFGGICFDFYLQLWLISNQRSSFHNSTLHPTHFCYCFAWESPRGKNYIPRTFTNEQHRFTQLRSRRRFGDVICINLQVMWNLSKHTFFSFKDSLST